MKQSTIIRLIIVTLLLVGLTFFSVQKEETVLSSGKHDDAMLIPNLATSASRIDRIAVGRPNKTLHIKKDDDDIWRLKERNGHPVSVAALNKTLDALASSELIAEKTAKPALLKQLGLTNSLATHLKLYEENEETPSTHLLIGRFSPDQNGTYVKRANEDKSWVASGNLSLPSKAVHWLDQKLFSIKPHHVRAITIETFKPENNVITIERPSLESLFSINGTPTDLNNRHEQYVLSALLRGLHNVVFYDVITDKVIEKNPRIKRYTIDTFDGLRITMSMHSPSRMWTDITAEFKPNLSLFVKPTGSIANIKNESDRAKSLAKHGFFPPKMTQRRVDAMNAKSNGWAYKMPSGMMQMITKDFEESARPQ